MPLNAQKISILVITLFLIIPVFSQKDNQDKFYTNADTKWLLEIPIWVPGFRGQLSYGTIDISTDTPNDKEDIESINKNPGLEFYFVGKASYKIDKFWFSIDAFSGTVGNTFTYTNNKGTKEKEVLYVSGQGTIPRMTLGYSVYKKQWNKNSSIEILPYTGLRYIYIEIESELIEDVKKIDIASKWLEPIIGISIPINYKRFQFKLQGDWGGTRDKNSTMINSSVNYRISKLIDTKIGWTSHFSNHTETVNDQILDFHINLQGPTIGLGFHL